LPRFEGPTKKLSQSTVAPLYVRTSKFKVFAPLLGTT